MRHRDEQRIFIPVQRIAPVAGFHVADVLEVEFRACAFDGVPVERSVKFQKVDGIAEGVRQAERSAGSIATP